MSDEAFDRVSRDHASLQALLETTRDRLESSDGAAWLESAEHLREAFEIHFAQEDSLYYPTILALRPEHRSALKGCMEAHDEFLEHLDRLVESAGRGSQADALRTLVQIVDLFDRHEAIEEEVLAAIDRERGTRRSGPRVEDRG